jgi:hypothetical protein
MDEQRRHVVQMLSEAVDAWSASVGSGRLGFDYAVAEYVEQTDNELSRAFQGYVQVLLNRQTDEDSSEIRRRTLTEISAHFDVPEVAAFVEAALESQDKQLSIGRTLEEQARRLHQALKA